MTYQEAIAYLDSFVNYEHQRDAHAMREVKLARMRSLCQRLGDPQRRFRSMLVTGTNGKGSICAMLYAMLRESPLRVGLYTSPHLEHVRERIRTSEGGPTAEESVYGHDWISEAAFAQLITELQPLLERMRGESPEMSPTYFEVLTAVALTYFHRQHIEIAILEVGLGGRLDATNIVEQAVSIISPIDIDHADVLGAHPAIIAKEKAGIIKPSTRLVITTSQHDEVMDVLRHACEEQGVLLVSCGQDLTVSIQRHDLEGLEILVTGLRGIYESLSLPLLGRHQAQNAAVAIAAMEALSPTGMPYSIIERGLSRVEWPGRLEIVHDSPLVLLDGAHNPHAAQALRETLMELCPGRRIHVLIGMSSDKSVEDVGRPLGELAFGMTCTQSHHPRALDPTTLATRLIPFCSNVHVMSDPADAYTYLLNAVASEDVIVVTGSLFLVGQLRAALRISHVRPRRQPIMV